ncbi:MULTISPECIES: hypothetical protein [unclassified Neorhizobium]|uniref:hypothetical protein n=1 Tax=unclassified Neorhizobium TaxID=2629175 RepID=UPI001FF45EC0|nr:MULTISPECIES: hypothetical protein [unclassified Neorhizobium]MCJ9671593.1 hypothetical protein [Neorhizobium sp. SHOUNA12B]MCJ9747722.1 hypothetical protein [Neorhizobium sp. SHOUNA12A]
MLELAQGDILRITSSTGGAFGDPFERDLGSIAREIENGMLSRERAELIYCVAFGPQGHIDAVATAERQKKRRGHYAPDFKFCNERERHDKAWPQRSRRELASLALTHELRIRSQLVERVHHRLVDAVASVDQETLLRTIGEEPARLSGVKVAAR